MKQYICLLIGLLAQGLWAQPDYRLSYYLPPFSVAHKAVPTPAEVIGHEIGQFHVSHDRLVRYMRAVADASDRVEIMTMGYTYEGREQVLLFITSEENQRRLNDIREEHVKLADPTQSQGLDLSDMPVFIWQGFTIHGNEPSGANAAMALLYYYAAAGDSTVLRQLDEAVILLDPCFNPDGMNRFAEWVNSTKSMNLVADPQNREQNEMWPGGRTNHYWFDLNRDWLPAQQPESQHRIRQFHRWKPNILTDHHEMGTNRTFFFQPGIPSRNNPNTPARNFELTEQIGTFHAQALDDIQSLYFSKESYDDFYYGKGSTFPDINGGIGILFEQASSRGHVQESDNGLLTFPFTIRNQVRTGLSTVEAGVALREDLLDYQRQFYLDAIDEAQDLPHQAIVVGSKGDAYRLATFEAMLAAHQIALQPLPKTMTLDGITYHPGHSFVIPLDQPAYRLIHSMFEQRTSFQDSLFYDVSAWTLPLAMNLDWTYADASTLAPAAETVNVGQAVEMGEGAYAYAIPWNSYESPKLLYLLQQKGFRAKVTTKAFTYKGRTFGPGTILIATQSQDFRADMVQTLMEVCYEEWLGEDPPFGDLPVALAEGLTVVPLQSGATGGINLGSPQIHTLEMPKVAMIVEGGVRAYDAGEVWHLLDVRMGMQLSLLPMHDLDEVDLSRYNTVIMVQGAYSDIGEDEVNNIKAWIKAGGNLIACKSANDWLVKQGIISLELSKAEPDTAGRADYADLVNIQGAQVTGGVILQADLDPSHPLGFGYNERSLPVFVNTNTYFELPHNPYAAPLTFTSDPQLSGYISAKNLARIQDKAAVVVSKYGEGKIVSFGFNPNFRAFWYGTNKLFMNAIFFTDVIDNRAVVGE